MATYDYDSTRTWVNVSGTDKRVKVPYVNDDGWKLAHHIWLKHGGEWKIVHKTQKSHGYTHFAQTTYNAGTGQSFTVPAHVRYLEVVVISAAGGGGAGVRTGGAGLAGGHYNCPSFNTTLTEYAEGGVGGNGGRIDAVIECKEGQVYTVDVSSGGTGGSYASPMELDYREAYMSSVGTSKTGGAGGNGTGSGYGSRLFCSANNTNIYVYNGAGGTGGTVAVTANCTAAGGNAGYTVSETDGTAGAAGNTRGSNIASDNLVSSTLSSEGNSYGSKGDHDTNGGAGDDGKVVINTYGPKGSFY